MGSGGQSVVCRLGCPGRTTPGRGQRSCILYTVACSRRGLGCRGQPGRHAPAGPDAEAFGSCVYGGMQMLAFSSRSYKDMRSDNALSFVSHAPRATYIKHEIQLWQAPGKRMYRCTAPYTACEQRRHDDNRYKLQRLDVQQRRSALTRISAHYPPHPHLRPSRLPFSVARRGCRFCSDPSGPA